MAGPGSRDLSEELVQGYEPAALASASFPVVLAGPSCPHGAKCRLLATGANHQRHRRTLLRRDWVGRAAC